MDYKIHLKNYMKLLNEGKFDEARIERTKSIPDVLYKFIPLYNDNKEKSEKRLKTLFYDCSWISKCKTLNDPYEFEGMYIDKEKLTEKGWKQSVLDLFDSMKNEVHIYSLTTRMADNLPMWAYYANNHQGFCVKYSILNKNNIYNVFYEPERIEISSIFARALNGMLTPSQDSELCREIARQIYCIKHSSWSAEEEYRLLGFNDCEMELKGLTVSNLDVGLAVSDIYAGINCNYKNDLKAISKKLNGAKYHECNISPTKFIVYD